MSGCGGNCELGIGYWVMRIGASGFPLQKSRCRWTCISGFFTDHWPLVTAAQRLLPRQPVQKFRHQAVRIAEPFRIREQGRRAGCLGNLQNLTLAWIMYADENDSKIVDGAADITIAGEVQRVMAGQMIIMPANKPHAVKAVKKFKMLLIMVKK